MSLKWRRRILISIVLACLAISLSIKFYDYFHFFSRDPWVLSDSEGLVRRLYGDEYHFIMEGMKLPEDAHILVLQRRWIANYYLYPRQIFHFKSKEATREEIEIFIVAHKIDWVAIVNQGQVTLQRVRSAP